MRPQLDRALLPRRPVTLMYHGFARSPRANDPDGLFVSEAALASQLAHLLAHGWAALDLDSYLAMRRPERRRSFLFTIDDGYTSVADVALPMLARYRVPAVLFVPSGLIGQTARWLPAPADEPLLDADELKQLVHAGVELGAHGFDHRVMTDLSDSELRRQVVEVREHLADLTGRPPRAFAYPYGLFDRRAWTAVRAAGYEVAFSVHRDHGQFGVSRVDVNATDTMATFRLKLLPAYRQAWRVAGRLGPLRRLVRRALTRTGTGSAGPP